MKKLVFFTSLLGALLILSACGPAKPMSPEEKKIEACANKAKNVCKETAKQLCKDKGRFKKMACEEASITGCMEAAKKACTK